MAGGGGSNGNLFTQGLSLGILVAWFKDATIVDSTIVSNAETSEMMVYGAVFSLAFGYVGRFLSIVIRHIESMDYDED